MNNPKVLSILNNAKIFLSTEELKELALCIDKEVGRPEPRKIRKSKPLQNWTLESVTENLLATQFKSKRRS
ncbi:MULTISPECIES: hypothetical protein [Flavobacterium]|uniref:Uncharacterized protein n=1 Tax=Flavobacterium succinicans TaxID=29536 RepID=A0A199XSF8_9FLAO|nr:MULTISPECIES: hypothetical protein [Flavobacterium]OAZ04683.1 hypothetical protein FLB_05300 [Flavobacterium succinicans]